jgi:hypothetical protein
VGSEGIGDIYVRSHFTVDMVTVTGVGGGILLFVTAELDLTGDEFGEEGDDGHAPVDTVAA